MTIADKQNHFPFLYHLLILTMGILLCGTLGVAIGRDLDWDLANYHYSNAYLFLHHQFNQDIWPASYLHVHFAPTADLLSYFLIHFFSPMMATFIIGGIQGVNLWLIFLITSLCLPRNNASIALGLILALLGMYGALGYWEIGTFRNDHLVCLFVLIFVFFQIRFFKHLMHHQTMRLSWLIIAGFFLGIAPGLKLTALGYVLGAGSSFLFITIPWRNRLIILVIWGMAVTLGLLLSSGYWMWILWQQYHNPVFPFLNNIFHSPDFPWINWHFTQFIPKSIGLTLIYPLYFSFHGTVADSYFFDLRYFYLYLLFLITAITTLWKKYRKHTYTKMNLATFWMTLFFIFTYIACQYDSGSIRYMLAIEMLTPLLIYLLIMQLIAHPTTRRNILFIIFFTMFITMHPQRSATRMKYYEKNYFAVTPPTFSKKTPDAMVLITYPEFSLYQDPRPIAFLIAFLPEHWRFMGIPFAHELSDLNDKKMMRKIQNTIAHYPGPFYLLAPERNMNELNKAANAFHLIQSGVCEKIDNIRSRLLGQDVLICPVKKDEIAIAESFLSACTLNA